MFFTLLLLHTSMEMKAASTVGVVRQIDLGKFNSQMEIIASKSS